MNKNRFLAGLALIASLLLCSNSSQAFAVENGVDATGNEFVVPIAVQTGTNSWVGCSGALIAPTIVVTAGHCAVDSNGLVTKNIFVGPAGSSRDSITSSDIVKSVEITSTYSDAANATVGDDDLAFLVLSKAQSLRLPIRLASEKEVNNFKANNVALKSLGYGCYTDSCTETRTSPKSFTGTFSQTNSAYSNSAFMQASLGHTCKGDSGGPIITSTPTSIVLVGITTGASMNNNCAIKWSDGYYRTLFTLISRYSNLAFGAASSSITDLLTQLKDAKTISDSASQNLVEANSKNSTLQTENASLTRQLANVSGALEDAQAQIADLESEITDLQAKLPATIVCFKGKLTQKVTAVKPKCPVGFKLKS